MTDKEIVERAKEAEKKTGFGELVHSPISKGVNSAFGIGFIEGMVEYRNSLQEEPVSEDLEEACEQLAENARKHKAETSSPFFSQTDYIQGVMDGAKWQLEKMMANAIEGGCFSYKNGFVHISCDIDEHLTDIKIGDKVKVIVIKED